VRKLTISKLYRGNQAVPSIRLNGKWLQAAGFDAGQSIQVTVEAGRLVITQATAR
jgi:hypothetical protein